MSADELRFLYGKLVDCRSAIDLFGNLSREPEKAKQELKKLRGGFLRMCHPDRYQGEDSQVLHIATEATSMVISFYNEASDGIKSGEYWERKPGRKATSSGTTIQTPLREYHIYSKIATGTIADVFLGDFVEDGSAEQVVIKVVRDSDDNILIRNEQSVVSSIRHKSMPTLVERFRTTEGKEVSVLRYEEGHDLYALRSNPRYKGGVPVEHVCWILERQLSVLGFVHSNVCVHGNIEPGNIVVRPKDHNAFLIDYTFSVRNTGDDDYIKCFTPGFSAPEVAKKIRALPTADLYALGKSMIYLIGGDIDRGTIPDHVDHRIATFLTRLIEPEYTRRVRDAWKLHQELVGLRTEVYGKERFKALVI